MTTEYYPGAKNAPGVFHTIINQIPPHDVFVEAFAGRAWITRHKRRAASTIVIESDPAVCADLVGLFTGPKLIEQFRLPGVGEHETELGDVRVVRGDAATWLAKNRGSFNERTVIYCDPPYLDATLAKPGRRYYRKGHMFGQEWLHGELLQVLHKVTRTGANVLISGRPHPLYDQMIGHWRRLDYQTRNRGHTITESLWCSFREPTELHDYRYLGQNFRERQRIKRKLARWRSRLAKMPTLERRLVAAALGKNGEAGL